jgi:hypothetical protein
MVIVGIGSDEVSDVRDLNHIGQNPNSVYVFVVPHHANEYESSGEESSMESDCSLVLVA